MNKNPIWVGVDEPQQTVLSKMKERSIQQLPVLDRDGKVVKIETCHTVLDGDEVSNWAFIMAGGLGKRLYPLTKDCPKPLLRVGSKPLLETIIDNFIVHKFKKFYISVNYKAEMIMDYFGDGSKFGIEIRYIREMKPLGTAGALSLLPEMPKKPILMMNGDLVTNVNFQNLLQYHEDHKAVATMCVRPYEFQVPYGVVKVDKHRFLDIDEKPTQQFLVNAGMYVFDPKVLSLIPKNEYFDIPDLFNVIKGSNQEISTFPIREYWLDIGHIEDFEKANAMNVRPVDS